MVVKLSSCRGGFKRSRSAKLRRFDEYGNEQLNFLVEIGRLDLKECEEIIEKHIPGFIMVSLALTRIHNEKLYLTDYKSWSAYLNERWGFHRSYAYRFIKAGSVFEHLSTIGDKYPLPVSECQVRALTKFNNRPDLETKGWISSCQASPEKPPTGEIVKAIVDEMLDDEKKVTLGISKEIQKQRKEKNRQKCIQKILSNVKNNIKLDGSIGKFPIILADPPWEYDFVPEDRNDVSNQYPVMALKEICDLPVPDIANDDSLLFLWSTSPKLRDAITVMEAWGFEYVTSFVWVKDKFGMGLRARQRHEYLLIGKKGNIPTPLSENRPDSVISTEIPGHNFKPDIFDGIMSAVDIAFLKSIAEDIMDSVISSERTGHSEKPDEVYKLIEKMYPEYPKIELFARREREGWTSWGNELKIPKDNDDDINDSQHLKSA